MELQKLRNEMYREIQSYNPNLTDSYLNTLSTKAVIANTHPLYRLDWQDLYDNIRKEQD